MQETGVRSPGQEDPLEEEMAIHSTILAWRILWTEELSGLQSTELQRTSHNLAIEHIKSPMLVIQLFYILLSVQLLSRV